MTTMTLADGPGRHGVGCQHKERTHVADQTEVPAERPTRRNPEARREAEPSQRILNVQGEDVEPDSGTSTTNKP
ncbi:hypothetical protein R1flu_012204 [Riccia fluitans]|uniref:Uncharacterized protein n=1 Tax=Riccia fluitans TaxID=41844 RepID=A0ABD1ZD95_9MARC